MKGETTTTVREQLLAAIQKGGSSAPLKKLNKNFDIAAVVPPADTEWQESDSLRDDPEVVLRAVCGCGMALQRASHRLRNQKEIVLAAVTENGAALEFASQDLHADKDVVMAAVTANGQSKNNRFASKDIMKTDCGEALQFASESLKADEEVALAAIQSSWRALEHCSEIIRSNKRVVLAAVTKSGWALQYASQELQDDKEVVMVAAINNEQILRQQEMLEKYLGSPLRFASSRLRADKKYFMAILRRNGNHLQFASECLRLDRECVLAAATSRPESLKYALGGLNQDHDCLVAAGLWDEDYCSQRQKAAQVSLQRKIVLSTRFSLNGESQPTATRFTVLLKEHPYFREGRNFVVYSPNAFNKSSCDPEWTRLEWPCRGTFDTCKKEMSLKTGVPKESECCWRYSFRHHLEEAKRTNGFMVQVVEVRNTDQGLEHQLGKGQEIERVMAAEVGTKVFAVHQPAYRNKMVNLSLPWEYSSYDIDQLEGKVREWEESNHKDMDKCDIHNDRVVRE